MLYGRFPNTTNFSSQIEFSFIFKMSSLIIVILFLNSLFSIKTRSLSFSITKIFFGFFFKIDEVRAPVPGPTSSTHLFSISIISVIFLIIFWSTKKF